MVLYKNRREYQLIFHPVQTFSIWTTLFHIRLFEEIKRPQIYQTKSI